MSRVNRKQVELATIEMERKALELGIFETKLKNYESIELRNQTYKTLLHYLRAYQCSSLIKTGAPDLIPKRGDQAFVYAVWIRVDETLPWIEMKGTYETRTEARKAAESFLLNLAVKIVSLRIRGEMYERDKLVKIVPHARKPGSDSKL